MVEKINKSGGAALGSIDAYSLLAKIKLSAGKAAEFCGVSRRQLCYWTDQGIVKSIGEGPGARGDASRRVYDFNGLYKVMLIKQAMSKGQGLKRAAQEVELYLKEREQQLIGLSRASKDEREKFLLEQAEKMEKLAGELGEKVSGSASGEQLLKLAEALQPLAQLSTRDTEGLSNLRDDPEASDRLRNWVEQLEIKVGDLADQE